MKKHHLILGCSSVFLMLFYHQTPGVNLAFFGLLLIGLIFYFFRSRFTTHSYGVLMLTSVLSALAFAWYGDFVSFLALFFSLAFLQFKTQNATLKVMLSVPVGALNFFASLGRILMFNQWLPAYQTDHNWIKRLIAYFIIPLLFLTVFFMVYSFGSDHFSELFTHYTLALDGFELIALFLLGLYISFSFWNYWVPPFFEEVNSKLDDDFSAEKRELHRPTFSFLDLDFERKSGEITLILLNLMLLVFIVTYNYEQFFQQTASTTLSAATHERVNAVIFSIIMAVGVVLLYFKRGFNFDHKASPLKRYAKIWVLLNGILILSTLIKNAEYVTAFGLTYKRLGVFAFLLLAIVGLVYTFLKIHRQKTNAYLFNTMIWYFYGTLLLCSFVNWGNLITTYNIQVNKGVEADYLRQLNFNEARCLNYFSSKPEVAEKFDYIKQNVEMQQNKSFLSKALYYEFIVLP